MNIEGVEDAEDEEFDEQDLDELELSADDVPATGTVDDDDDPNDEHEGENEAPVREARDSTEAPEEFEVDDEDEA